MDKTTPSRLFLVLLACIHTVFCSGIAYGWTALRPILLADGIFDAFDTNARAAHLSLVATMGIAANALCKLPLGAFMDTYGPRATSLIGSGMMITGSLMLAFLNKNSVLSITMGYFLIGLAGPFLQMPCFQFANLYPETRSTVVSFMVVCFELSTGVFEVFSFFYFGSGGLIGRNVLFGVYSLVGVFTLVTGIIFWPDQGYDLVSKTEVTTDDRLESPLLPSTDLASLPIIDQFTSPQFVYITIFFVCHIFRQGFVITTMGPQLEYFFPAKTASEMGEYFSIMLPLGFLPMSMLAATGIAGYILNRPNVAFIFVNIISITYGLIFLFPSVPAFLVLFLLFPVARQFVFSTFFSYASVTFGAQNFGKISGLASTFASIFQLIGQPALIKATVDSNNSLTWTNVDLVLGLLPLPLIFVPLYQMFKEAKYRREKYDLSDGIPSASSDGPTENHPLISKTSPLRYDLDSEEAADSRSQNFWDTVASTSENEYVSSLGSFKDSSELHRRLGKSHEARV